LSEAIFQDFLRTQIHFSRAPNCTIIEAMTLTGHLIGCGKKINNYEGIFRHTSYYGEKHVDYTENTQDYAKI